MCVSSCYFCGCHVFLVALTPCSLLLPRQRPIVGTVRLTSTRLADQCDSRLHCACRYGVPDCAEPGGGLDVGADDQQHQLRLLGDQYYCQGAVCVWHFPVLSCGFAASPNHRRLSCSAGFIDAPLMCSLFRVLFGVDVVASPHSSPQCFLVLFNIITLRNWTEETPSYFLEHSPLDMAAKSLP